MTRTTFYTATTLDGFIADEHDSLEWLFTQPQDEGGPMNYDEFIKDVGAIAMGATTYEWLVDHHAKSGETWMYEIPSWVFTHRDLGRSGDGSRSPPRRWPRCTPRWPRRPAARTSGWSAAATWPRSSPSTGCSTSWCCRSRRSLLGAGRPLFPRRLDLELQEFDRNGAFLCARYAVLPTGLIGIPVGYAPSRDRRRTCSPCSPRLLVAPAQRRRAAGEGSGRARVRRRRHLGRPATPPGSGCGSCKNGGNAVDAAVATAAALGVTEPFSAGIGGGGYFVYYDAEVREGAHDRRARDRAGRDAARRVHRPGDRRALQLLARSWSPAASRSGCPARWRPGSARSTGGAPATSRRRCAGRRARATRGFGVDQTFRGQVRPERGAVPGVRARPSGSTGAAGTRRGSAARSATRTSPRRTGCSAREGSAPFYEGELAGEIVRAVRKPPTTQAHRRCRCPKGFLVTPRPEALPHRSTRRRRTSSYRGLDVYGMAPSSSGGSTVGEALNILENHDLGALPPAEALHLYLEASALAFADRGAYVGDPAQVDVPLDDLLSDEYAAERDCQIDPTHGADQAGRGRRRDVVRRRVRPAARRRRRRRTPRTSRRRT